MNNKGQTVMAEHVMIFFIVVAALVAMTTFVQRAFEARIHDTRDFMINGLMNSSVCDANCVAATGNKISYEYEPYYTQMKMDVQNNSIDFQGETNGQAKSIGAIFINTVNEQTQAVSGSSQLPPGCANGANCAGL